MRIKTHLVIGQRADDYLRQASVKQSCRRRQGQAMKGGHFFPEENPDDTAVLIKQFLAA